MGSGRRTYTTAGQLALVLIMAMAGCAKSGDLAAACKANLDINAGFTKLFTTIPGLGEGPPPASAKPKIKAAYDRYLKNAFDEIEANKPKEIEKEITDALVEARKLGTGEISDKFDKPPLTDETNRIDAYFFNSCSGAKTAITGVDYAFKDVPATLKSGNVQFKFTNGGTEHHEMVILTRNAGVTDSWDTLLGLQEDQTREKTQFITEADSEPGKSGYTSVALKAGDYLMLCGVKQGTSGDKEGTGPEHFKLGMKQEFKVV